MSRPPVVGPDLKVWANDLRHYLSRLKDRLTWRVSGQNASDNGMLLWDEAAGYPVVSLDGVWRRVGTFVAAPASATASGKAGHLATDASYIYVCTATDTWKRVAISTW
jgi:hypothetical protein